MRVCVCVCVLRLRWVFKNTYSVQRLRPRQATQAAVAPPVPCHPIPSHVKEVALHA